jgi:hypothetical protein
VWDDGKFHEMVRMSVARDVKMAKRSAAKAIEMNFDVRLVLFASML